MGAKLIDSVGLADGRQIPLDAYECNHCGREGSPYLALSDQGAWAFCSWECRQEAIKIDGEAPTAETMKAAGLHFIGPRPEA